MKGESGLTGTAEQEEFFGQLWDDYWLAQAVPGAVSAHGKPRRWREGMALFASTRASYELALQKAQIDIWKKT